MEISGDLSQQYPAAASGSSNTSNPRSPGSPRSGQSFSPHPLYPHYTHGQPYLPHQFSSYAPYYHPPTRPNSYPAPGLSIYHSHVDPNHFSGTSSADTGAAEAGTDRPNRDRHNSQHSASLVSAAPSEMSSSSGPAAVSPYHAGSAPSSEGHGSSPTRWVWMRVQVPDTQHEAETLNPAMGQQYGGYAPYYAPSSSSSSTYQTPQYSDGTLMSPTAPYGMHPMTAYGQYGFVPQPYMSSVGPPLPHARPNWHPQAGMVSQTQPINGVHLVPHLHSQPQAWRPMGAAGTHHNQRNSHGNRKAGHGPSSGSTEFSSPRRTQANLPFRPSPTGSGNATSSLPISNAHNRVKSNMALSVEIPPSASTASPEAKRGNTSSNLTPTAAEPQPNLKNTRSLSQHQGARSDFVLWCGNVPHDATEQELFDLFSQLVLDETDQAKIEALKPSANVSGLSETVPSNENGPSEDKLLSPRPNHGVLSIFIISRSNCAFVNYATKEHLERALTYFNGKPIRPNDSRCPKLVCRVRKKDDEAQAGVAGQRGRGIHVSWFNQQKEAEKRRRVAEQVKEQPLNGIPDKCGYNDVTSRPKLDSVKCDAASSPEIGNWNTPTDALTPSSGSYSSCGSASYASSNSSLFRHPYFSHRFFILKSLRKEELDRSVQTGYWATQLHNEAVLDQAYRNSEAVYLIFGVNQSGSFYGYAKMTGPIRSNHDSVGEGETDIHKLHLEPESMQDVKSTLSSRPMYAEELSEPPPSFSSIAPFANDAVIDLPDEGIVTPRGSQSLPNSQQPKMQDPPFTSNSVPNSSESFASQAGRLEPYEYAIKRLDMMGESSPTTHQEERLRLENSSMSPTDSISHSSSDSRVAEQHALRAVIHNLRLDERESRGRADQLENHLRSCHDDDEEDDDDDDRTESSTQKSVQQSGLDTSLWGTPFKVEWIKTTPLPFQRVQKFRNPWRDNRQVKVSRDGTELEPTVGHQILEEWNKSVAETIVLDQKKKKRTPSNLKNKPEYDSDEDED